MSEEEVKYDAEYHENEPEVLANIVNIEVLTNEVTAEVVKIPRVYSLDQERKIIKELYSKVYRVMTGELDEEGNVPTLDLEGPNPWGLFELQVVSLLLNKPRNECHADLIAIKKHCISVGTDFISSVKSKNIIRMVVDTDTQLSDMTIRKNRLAELSALDIEEVTVELPE